jgi:hypothetical protein
MNSSLLPPFFLHPRQHFRLQLLFSVPLCLFCIRFGQGYFYSVRIPLIAYSFLKTVEFIRLSDRLSKVYSRTYLGFLLMPQPTGDNDYVVIKQTNLSFVLLTEMSN